MIRHRFAPLALGALAGVFLIVTSYAVASIDDESFFTHLHTDKAMANVTVTPGRTGPVSIMVQLETTDEQPLSAMSVVVRLTSTQAGRAALEVAAERTSDDQWVAKLSVPSAGRWDMGLKIKLSEADEVNVASPILIR